MLVTGGNGYLGGRIIEYLTQRGVSVIVGSRTIFTNRGTLEAACKNVEAVIHLAAMNAQECAGDPEGSLLVNGLNSLRLLNAAESMRVSRFIYFSTAHVYGSPLVGKFTEEHLPRPLHHYSITHRLAEDYVLEANIRGKLSGIVLRLTNAVGRPISSDVNCWMLVVNDICRQVVVNKEMVLHSPETVERDYVPISTVTSAISFVLDNGKLDEGIYNLSSGTSYSLRRLTNLIADRSLEILGFKPTIKFPLRYKVSNVGTSDNVMRLVISNDKLKLAGFNVNTDLTYEIDRLLLACQSWFDG